MFITFNIKTGVYHVKNNECNVTLITREAALYKVTVQRVCVKSDRTW
jgi:hypothetical protein